MLKIQFLNGGLANQSFQYIFARYYELSHPGEIMYLDDSYFALNTVHNGYELDKVFGIKPHMLSEAFDKDVWQYMLEQKQKGKSIPQIIYENGEKISMLAEYGGSNNFNPFEGTVMRPTRIGYCPEIQDIPENVYYHGYWIDVDWFMRYERNFRHEFTFPPLEDDRNQKLLYDIRNGNSLSVHVRRGDYVTLGYAAAPEAYSKSIDMFRESVNEEYTLYIFSDDINWCKGHEKELHFDKFSNRVYVEGNTDGNNYIDLQLMSNCKTMIITNSAFCYLASILNKGLTGWINTTKRKIR